MTKRKALLMSFVFVLLLSVYMVAVAEANPIAAKIEINPEKLAQPGPVEVTISITNTGTTDFTEPIMLFDPAAKPVEDFGTGGECLLAAGQTATWSGTYNVSRNTLDNGAITYFIKYKELNANGELQEAKQVLRAVVSQQTAETDITVKRTISPTVAREGQEIVVSYEIKNTGSVALNDIVIQENKAVYKEKQTIQALNPGASATLKYTVVMGTKDITSGAKITYKSETKKKTQTYTVENQTIKYGTSKLTGELSSSSKGVVENGTVTLTLKLKNGGTLNYSDIRVTDANLGDLFVEALTGKELAAGKSLTLEQELTVPQTTEYQLAVTVTDETGNEESITTEPLTVSAISADDALHLQVNVTANRTEVFEQPGKVRFTIEISNDSKVDAANVVLRHGETVISRLGTLAAGKTRVLTRDTALSMAGKYQFTVTASDPLENSLSFSGNEIQIVFSVPTPVPATPTPLPEPTPEPVFQPATIPPKSDASIGAVPKAISSVLIPVGWVAGVLMAISVALMIAAKIRQLLLAKSSKGALDTLNAVLPRDYNAAEQEDTVAVTGEYGQLAREESAPIERGSGDFVDRYGNEAVGELSGLMQDTLDDEETPDDLENMWNRYNAQQNAADEPSADNWQQSVADSQAISDLQEVLEAPVPAETEAQKPRRRRTQG